jgi:hypothetical protein
MTTNGMDRRTQVGKEAEAKVLNSLQQLPAPWRTFDNVEWRKLEHFGEEVGEADFFVFHPQYGVIAFEVKGGNVSVVNGEWLYGNGKPMKTSPMFQARRSRFALQKRLKPKLGSVVDDLTFTHAVWFPDVRWPRELQLPDAPSNSFVLDITLLDNPEPRLLQIFKEAAPEPKAWTKVQQNALKDLLAPDWQLQMPLVYRLEGASQALLQATEQQMSALRLLRTQSRLLVEGGAGSGKTLLAVTLAREHAALGKQVLLTCFNKALANQLATFFNGQDNVTVVHFHELVRQAALQAGLPYTVPQDKQKQSRFFREDCAELLMSAAEQGAHRYDSIIVDEAADFLPDWWAAIECLGQPDFCWYCFYDRHQTIYFAEHPWSPPFKGEPMPLDVNLRNTRPVGMLAARLGHCPPPAGFRVETGPDPVVKVSPDFQAMSEELRKLLKSLTHEQMVPPERIVVLAPYRHSNPQSLWAAGLKGFALNENVSVPEAGKIGVATIQGFKGLEADVVILAGLNAQILKSPELLYVGASRAKAGLYVLSLEPLAD